MSLPYVTDVANAIFGTQWNLPVPVFGVVVLIAVFLSTLVFRKEVARSEARGLIPGGTAALISDLVFVGCSLASSVPGFFISGDGDTGEFPPTSL